jgi:transcriptional regulator of NAD metabolism
MLFNIESRKIELIAFIALLQQEEAINAIEKIVQQYKFYGKTEPNLHIVSESDVEYFKRPIRESITVDDLVREQNWKPIDEAKMDALVKKMDIQEPIELLMAQLTH